LVAPRRNISAFRVQASAHGDVLHRAESGNVAENMNTLAAGRCRTMANGRGSSSAAQTFAAQRYHVNATSREKIRNSNSCDIMRSLRKSIDASDFGMTAHHQVIA
jgi:hypothetical protein